MPKNDIVFVLCLLVSSVGKQMCVEWRKTQQ